MYKEDEKQWILYEILREILPLVGSCPKLQSRIYTKSDICKFAVPKLGQRLGNSDVDNASWDCFGGRAFCVP